MTESKRSTSKHIGWKTSKKNQVEATKFPIQAKEDTQRHAGKKSKTPHAAQTNHNTKTSDVKSPKKLVSSTPTKKITSASTKRKSRWYSGVQYVGQFVWLVRSQTRISTRFLEFPAN